MSVKNGFDPKDLEEISSRPRSKFKMNKNDYKELGRNLLLGTVDVAVGGIMAIGLIGSIADSKSKTKKTAEHLKYSWEDRPYESENRDI